jgi:AhpD family alkylhydroperoxidase
MDWKAHLTHQSTTLDTFRKAHPDAARGFTALHHGTLAEGALSVREKELQALAIGIVKQCTDCIGFHVQAAHKAGRHAGPGRRNRGRGDDDGRRPGLHVRRQGAGGLGPAGGLKRRDPLHLSPNTQKTTPKRRSTAQGPPERPRAPENPRFPDGKTAVFPVFPRKTPPHRRNGEGRSPCPALSTTSAIRFSRVGAVFAVLIHSSVPRLTERGQPSQTSRRSPSARRGPPAPPAAPRRRERPTCPFPPPRRSPPRPAFVIRPSARIRATISLLTADQAEPGLRGATRWAERSASTRWVTASIQPKQISSSMASPQGR